MRFFYKHNHQTSQELLWWWWWWWCSGQLPGQVSFISLTVRGSMKLELVNILDTLIGLKPNNNNIISSTLTFYGKQILKTLSMGRQG